MPLHPFPSFASVLSSDDTVDLPDYYRTTRLEEYGPYYRPSAQLDDFMKRIDLRYDTREFTASFLLPGIEEYELVSDELANNDPLDADQGARTATAPKTPRFAIRVFSNIWRKCRMRRFISRKRRHRDDSNTAATAEVHEPNKGRRHVLDSLN